MVKSLVQENSIITQPGFIQGPLDFSTLNQAHLFLTHFISQIHVHSLLTKAMLADAYRTIKKAFKHNAVSICTLKKTFLN